jgi:alpha,alpha-trehalase
MSTDRTGTSCVKARCVKARVLRTAATGGVLAWLLLVRAPDAIALEPGAEVLPPHALYGELFTRVQQAQVFADGKDFCDALPKGSPAEILARYRAAAPRTPEELKAFVAANFTAPAAIGSTPGATVARAAAAAPAGTPLITHIDALWGVLTRQPADVPPYSSLLPLPRPFVVPGGRFREIYYWDSYFTMLGLLESGRADLTRDMVSDFAHLIDRYGRIPNGNRTYYLSRSQPPFFFAMVALLDPGHPERAFARYLPQLEREYAFWMDGATSVARGLARQRVVAVSGGRGAIAVPPRQLLNRYWDDEDLPRDESYREDVALADRSGRDRRQLYRDVRAAAESGWDFSSRWFADAHSLTSIDTTDIVPVDLNSLLFGLEQAIAAGCGEAHDEACQRAFREHAGARRAAMDRYLWDAVRGTYFDYQWARGERIPRVSAATLYPLFVHAASRAQAAAVARIARAQLLKRGGLVTTTLNTGQQWDAPNGWAPLQWIAVAGLNAYGESGLAEEIACRWTVNVARAYRESGKLVEKYDVTNTDRPGGGGEYPLQDGFGWTNGVTRRLLALYPAHGDYRSVDECGRPRPAAHPGAASDK